MRTLWILAIAAPIICIAVLIISYICFRIGFYAAPRKGNGSEIDLPAGEIYEPFWPAMRKWIMETRAMPQEDVYITSFDGLKLHGKYFEYAPGAPIELMFHGYRGAAERDLAGGVQRCFKVGRSALIVDQRCAGESEGSVITFGVKEYRDCLSWVDFMLKKFGPEVKIILTGISMGATTVLIAGGQPLPENVIGILADCGFTSAKEIIHSVIKQMGLPPKLAYPFVKLGAKLFGHFDLEAVDAISAVRNCKVPVIFYHGDADDYVPCHMSEKNYEACTSRKKLVIIPGAGHGLSYPIAPEYYRSTLREFFGPEASSPAPQK